MNLNLSKIGRFSFTRRGILCLLLSTYCTMVSAQSFPVQVIPQALPPAPIYISNYADASTVTSPLRVQIILNDFEISNREVRLKTYFTGSGLSFQSNDIVVGASPLFLEGGIPLVLTNVELAPYFEFNNITGINANQYGNAIPEGAYQFCVEVYDILTGSRLSNKSCAVSVVFQNEPPFLVLPRNKENVDEINPQYIVFQWTPRSINVSNVEYELSLVEIWDNQVDPQQAFLSSPPVFQTTTTATTYVYGPSDPLLLSGKNYAWRVQAKAKQGTEEIGLFKNEGYSEIYSFSYASACELPLAINHEVKGSTNANIFWDDFSTDIPEYTVRYRKKSPSNSPGGGEANPSPSGGGREGDNAWFLSKTTANLLTLWDLKAGTTYEYQVNKKCTVTESDWSLSKQFTTFIADDEESVYECGIAPDFTLTNQDPLQTLGDKFTAGDFPIKVIEASGSNGRFTGKGYVTIPYLNSIKVGVEFTNVLINTDNQLVEGSVITMYDPSLKNILDIDDAIDTVTDAVDAVGDFVDALADWLSGYTGTEDEQKELEEKTEELNKELDEAIANPNLDPEKKEDLKKSKDDLNKAKDDLLKEGANPTSESKEAYQNISQEVKTELNTLEGDSQVTPDANQNITGDDYFDGVIEFSTPETTIQTATVEGNTQSFVIEREPADGSEGKAQKFQINANKKLIVSHDKLSSTEIDKIKSDFENVGSNEYLLRIHYDYENNKVKYKVAFGNTYYAGIEIQRSELAKLYNDVLNFNLKEAIGSAILGVTESLDILLEQYKDQIPYLNKELFAGYTTYDALKVALNFASQCSEDYQTQTSGIVPKCFWDNENPLFFKNAYYAGFIDGAWEGIELVGGIIKFREAWNPLSPFFSDPKAFEIRQQTIDLIMLIKQLDEQDTLVSSAKTTIKEEFNKYIDETLDLDAQARYNQGKLIFDVASLFFGYGEVKLLLKTGKITSTTLQALRKVPANFGALVKGMAKFGKGVIIKLDNITGDLLIAGQKIATINKQKIIIAKEAFLESLADNLKPIGQLITPEGYTFDVSDGRSLAEKVLNIVQDTQGKYKVAAGQLATSGINSIEELVASVLKNRKNIRNVLDTDIGKAYAKKYFDKYVSGEKFEDWWAYAKRYDLNDDLNFEVHHIIPIKVFEKSKKLQELLLWAKQQGKKFDFNSIDNGIPLQKKKVKIDLNGHTNHPKYDIAITEKLNKILDDLDLDSSEKFEMIQDLINKTKTKLEKDVLLGNKDVNQIIDL